MLSESCNLQINQTNILLPLTFAFTQVQHFYVRVCLYAAKHDDGTSVPGNGTKRGFPFAIQAFSCGPTLQLQLYAVIVSWRVATMQVRDYMAHAGFVGRDEYKHTCARTHAVMLGQLVTCNLRRYNTAVCVCAKVEIDVKSFRRCCLMCSHLLRTENHYQH